MLDSTQVNANRAITVPFHGADLYVVEHNGQPYTPMKPIVTAMGLDWKSQHRKVAANQERWGITIMVMPSAVVDSTIVGAADGKTRELTCIPIRKVAAWLTTIEPGKVKNPEVRARVIQYQNECDDALWQYWSDGIAVNPRATQHDPAIDYDRISPAQAQDLKDIVQAIVNAGIQSYGETWKRLQNKFKVNSYLQLPATSHLEARQYLVAKLPNGHHPEVLDEAPTINLTDADRLDSAMTLAIEAGAQAQRSVFNAVMAGNSDWKHGRYMLRFDTAVSSATVARVNAIERDACVLPMERFHEAIEESFTVDAQTLARLATTCAGKLGRMAQRMSGPGSAMPT